MLIVIFALCFQHPALLQGQAACSDAAGDPGLAAQPAERPGRRVPASGGTLPAAYSRAARTFG